MSVGRGPLAAPVFDAPKPIVYGFSGPRVFIQIPSPGSNLVDYIFTSSDEMGIDTWVGCKYRRVGSSAPSLAQHEIVQALQAGHPVDHRQEDPVPGTATAAPSGPPPVLSYEDSIKEIDRLSNSQ